MIPIPASAAALLHHRWLVISTKTVASTGLILVYSPATGLNRLALILIGAAVPILITAARSTGVTLPYLQVTGWNAMAWIVIESEAAMDDKER